MQSEEITLECPYCREAITRPLPWFKQPYATCPACGGGLTAGQFAALLGELEQAFDASIEEMVAGAGEPESGCKAGGCGGCRH